jgi:hypothetical protein
VVARALAEREHVEVDEPTPAPEAQRAETHPVLDLQRTAGNAAVARALREGGTPLEPSLRAAMERRLGGDLGSVRIHAGTDADASARAVNARAYTVGQDVVLGEGADDASLEHELVHTLQQPKGRVDGEAVQVAPRGTSLEQAAERGSAQGSTGRPVLQRQPAPDAQAEPESLFTIFVADEARKTDVRFARDQARKDAAAIRKAGTLTKDDRDLVKAKLRFFEGDAWQAYSDTIRPALVEVTQEEIDMGEPAPKPKLEMPNARLKSLQEQPTYIDNEIQKVSFYFAEQAIIHYRDGTTYELGLAPKWMKPPVVEVDYLTPEWQIHAWGPPSGTGPFGYINEAEPPPSTAWSDLPKFVHGVDFYVEPGTGRVIPSRINMLTAPNLCRVLRDSLKQWEEEYVGPAVELGTKGVAIVGMYAGQGGGYSTNTGIVATKMFQSTVSRALSPTARKMAGEMDSLLAKEELGTIEAGGVEFTGVTVEKVGSTVAVKRIMSSAAVPGQGTGYVMAIEFERAAVEVGRMNGAKTVTVDVGIIVNEGWKKVLEGRGYVEISPWQWVKTIKVQ